MAGNLGPIGVASKKLRKARAKTFGDIRKAKIDIVDNIRITKESIFDV